MESFSTEFGLTLRQVLSAGSSQSLTPLDPVTCQALLQDSPPLSQNITYPDVTDDSLSPGLRILIGYPPCPLYKRLAEALCHWSLSRECPVFELPTMFMLNEQAAIDQRRNRMDEITPKLTGAPSLWECWSEDEKKHFIVDILQMLGTRGVLDLLGVRETVGSSHLLPPPREALLESFLKLHCPPSQLTVGARALAKHHHRDNTESWWGVCTGSEDKKNSHALQIVLKIMVNAMWINVHSLPHETKVVEMRTMEGYGARWLLDGSEFRGFLEPQMVDGHEVGWKH